MPAYQTLTTQWPTDGGFSPLMAIYNADHLAFIANQARDLLDLSCEDIALAIPGLLQEPTIPLGASFDLNDLVFSGTVDGEEPPPSGTVTVTVRLNYSDITGGEAFRNFASATFTLFPGDPIAHDLSWVAPDGMIINYDMFSDLSQFQISISMVADQPGYTGLVRIPELTYIDNSTFDGTIFVQENVPSCGIDPFAAYFSDPVALTGTDIKTPSELAEESQAQECIFLIPWLEQVFTNPDVAISAGPDLQYAIMDYVAFAQAARPECFLPPPGIPEPPKMPLTRCGNFVQLFNPFGIRANS
jgi:hypothetical protein